MRRRAAVAVLAIITVAAAVMSTSAAPIAAASTTASKVPSSPSRPTAQRGTGQHGGFTSVAALSPTDVWAVGWVGPTAYQTSASVKHWNGTSWQRVPAPHPGHPSIYESVSAVSPDDVWAAGYFSDHAGWKPLVVHWDGASWQRARLAPGATLANGISADASDDVWVVGRQPVGPYPGWAEHWDGSTWTMVTLPSTGSLNAVSAVAPDDVWAVGNDPSRTVAEHWDGTQWSTETTKSPDRFQNILRGVAALATGQVFAAGLFGHDELEQRAASPSGPRLEGLDTLVEASTGSAFRRVLSPDPGGYSWFDDVTATATDNVWFVGAGGSPSGRAAIAHWDGTNWSVATPAPPNTSVADFSAIAQDAPTDVWAVGTYTPIGGGSETLTYVRQWDGHHWHTR
jgi:hypothetical protein